MDEVNFIPEEPPAPPPVTRPSARERILRAAEALFAERGFDQSSVGEIAYRAGVNRALLYYYFRQKDDIYRQIMVEGMSLLKQVTSNVLEPGMTVREAVGVFIEAYLDMAKTHPGLVRIVYREIVGAQHQDSESRAFVDEFVSTIWMLRAVLERGIQAGELEPHDPTKGVISLFGLTNVFITVDYLEGASYTREEVRDHIMRVFLDGLGARVSKENA